MAEKTLRYALLAGVVYFVAMATAHFFGIKVPLLFVYWNNPFFAYQDKIIAFAVMTYAALFYTAARHRVAVPAALFSITVTAIGLSLVNLSDALQITLAEGVTSTSDWQIAWSATSTADAARLSTGPYWLQTGLIAGYAVLLQVLYWRSGEADSSGSEAPSPVSS